MYLIGTDEAGYGPNLGPLVISATAWQVPDALCAEGLYEALEAWVATRPDRAGADAAQPPRVVVADSKAVYQPGKGLAGLERTVTAALALLGKRPQHWADIWPMLDPASADALAQLPWYATFDEPLPVDVPAANVLAAAGFLAEGLARTGIRLLDVRSCVLFEDEFNRRVAQYGSKGAVLTHATLQLASNVLALFGDEPIYVTCDKHGGRNAYASLLDRYFPDRFLEICGESRQKSTYRFGPAERRVEIRFEAHGESYLTTALASMTSKYLRELAMRAVNAFWAGRVSGLTPTAGYPVDAKRFKNDIAAVQAECGIADQLYWRSR
jgi:hypothetical protein